MTSDLKIEIDVPLNLNIESSRVTNSQVTPATTQRPKSQQNTCKPQKSFVNRSHMSKHKKKFMAYYNEFRDMTPANKTSRPATRGHTSFSSTLASYAPY